MVWEWEVLFARCVLSDALDATTGIPQRKGKGLAEGESELSVKLERSLLRRENMEKLLPETYNQAHQMTITPGPDVNAEELGHWYSPARVAILIEAERDACIALHEHENVLAPVGNSSWGEAHQQGWIEGAAAYRNEILKRSNVELTGRTEAGEARSHAGLRSG